MSSRRPQAADSLELLLDTLCNTFGGVLFIAMLVVVLLQMAGNGVARPNDLVNPTDLRELADELEVLGRELESLEKTDPAHMTGATRSAEGSANPAERLAEAMAKLDDIQRKMDSKLVETGRHDAEAVSQNQAADDLKERLARAENVAEDLRKKIEKEEKANARTIHTPLMHTTAKQPLGTELRYGRLYVVHKYSSSGERQGPNLDEYVLLSNEDGESEITADQSRGLTIVDGPTLSLNLATRLKSYKSSEWYLDLAVRSGSFGAYHKLSEAARSIGYEIRITLVAEEGAFHDRGGRGQGVQ